MIDEKIAIYLAVLNQGEIAVELTQCLDSVLMSSDYPLFIDYSCEKPISYNRNQIVKRFLERTQYDYLVMLDSDIVPPPNFLNLVGFQKDIISPVCFAFTPKKIIFPLVLKLHPKRTFASKYKPYDSVDPKRWTGLIEVDAVGTGSIILSRKVVEAIHYPFRNEYDKNGEKMIGLDLNFCRRAKEKGFQVFCHTDYVCSHHTRFDLKSIYYTMRHVYKEVDKLNEEKSNLQRQNDSLKRKLDNRKNTKGGKKRIKIISDNNREESCDGIICTPKGENVSGGRYTIPTVQPEGQHNNSGTGEINQKNITEVGWSGDTSSSPKTPQDTYTGNT